MRGRAPVTGSKSVCCSGANAKDSTNEDDDGGGGGGGGGGDDDPDDGEDQLVG